MQEEGLSWPPSLDFTGGARLEYQLDDEDSIRKGIETSDERMDALQRCQEVFLFRLRRFDLSEITVKPLGDNRLICEVPGTEAIERVKEDIGKAAVLTFRIASDTPVSDPEKLSQLPEDVRENYFRYRDQDFYLKVGEPLLDASDISYRGTEVKVAPRTLEDPKGGIYIRLELKQLSKSKLVDITNKYYQKRLAICLDNEIVSAPKIAARDIREPIITGDFTATEARELVKILRAGPLPVSLNLKSQVFVSPALGKEAFHRGLIALVVGICFVAVLLGVSYVDHLAMLVAFVVCMTLEGVLLFILGRMGWLTLNMVSLSGLVVLIGISVDNLILIFEEFRGFQLGEKAFTTGRIAEKLIDAINTEKVIILLANVTTVATLLPLYFFVQGPITDLVKIMVLGIAIAVLINVFFVKSLFEKGSFVHFLENMSSFTRPLLSVRFLLFSLGRPLLLLYIVVVVASGVLLVSKGLERGLDFTGGTEVVLLSDQGIGTDKVREYAWDYFGERCEVKRVKNKYSDEQQGFQYVVRIPSGQNLAAKVAGEEQGVTDESSTMAGLTAEKFIGYIRSKVSIPIRIASVDILGPTVVALNRPFVAMSVLLGLFFLIVIIGLWYGMGYTIPVIMALILDGLIVLGAISLFRVPLSIAVVAALLTVIGYSINDSIVICGHVHRAVIREGFASILEPLSSRVVLTSATTAGVAAALWIFGRGLIRDFGLVITVGAVFGTISSISLVVIMLEEFDRRGWLRGKQRPHREV
jgi:SecD/SecF fusion protein